jgi:hypothetical protein
MKKEVIMAVNAPDGCVLHKMFGQLLGCNTQHHYHHVLLDLTEVAHVDSLQATEFALRLLVFAFVQTVLLVYMFGQCDLEALH